MQPDTSSEASAPRGADIRTFLFADVRGYTRYTGEHGDEAASLLAGKLAEIVRDVVPKFHGDLFELRGDEAASVFFSAREAIRAAVEVQRRLREQRDGEARFPLGVGMGMDAGEAVPTEGGFRGGALNLAARLCAIAKPGQVLASDHAAHLAGRVEGVRLERRRAVRLKGMSEPVRLVEVVSEVPLPPVPARTRRRRRRSLWIAAGAAVVAAVAVLVVASLDGGHAVGRGARVLVAPNSVAVIDTRTDRVVADVRVRLTSESAYGTKSPDVAYGDGYLWTYDGPSQTLWRINPKTLRPEPFGIGFDPDDLTTSPGHVWVASEHLLTDRDPNTPTDATTIPLKHSFSTTLAYGDGRIWVASGEHLTAVNPQTDHISAQPHAGFVRDVASAGHAVWVTDNQTVVVRDVFPPFPGSSALTLASTCPYGDLAIGYGAVWFAGCDSVWKLTDAPPVTVLDRISTHFANAITVGAGAIWVADTATGDVLRIDPNGDTITKIPLGPSTGGIAYGDHRIWVAVPGRS